MSKVVIIHGWGNNSQGNWFPWLKTELESHGYTVSVPDFPDTENPKLKDWLKTLVKVIGTKNEKLILVGHSLGSTTILRYLDKIDKPIKAAILVAGFFSPNPDIDEAPILNFLEPPWNWEKICRGAQNFFVINSDNDPYVPLAAAKILAKKLGQRLILKKGCGHFNAAAGFTQFPYLLKIFDKQETNR